MRPPKDKKRKRHFKIINFKIGYFSFFFQKENIIEKISITNIISTQEKKKVLLLSKHHK